MQYGGLILSLSAAEIDLDDMMRKFTQVHPDGSYKTNTSVQSQRALRLNLE